MLAINTTTELCNYSFLDDFPVWSTFDTFQMICDFNYSTCSQHINNAFVASPLQTTGENWEVSETSPF